MLSNKRMTDDCAIGVNDIQPDDTNVRSRHDAMLMSLIRSNLIAMWKNYDLTFGVLLYTIEEMGNDTAQEALDRLDTQYTLIEAERAMQFELKDWEW